METERLFLRRYVTEDKADFIALFTDPTIMKYVGEGVLSQAQAEAFWLKLFETLYPQNFNIWAVFEKENSQYVGHAGIYPRPTKKTDWEFVYFLNRQSWSKGFATEIAKRIIDYGFNELNLHQVFATVDDDHSASIRVLKKAGMTFNRFEFDDKGQFSVYSINKS